MRRDKVGVKDEELAKVPTHHNPRLPNTHTLHHTRTAPLHTQTTQEHPYTAGCPPKKNLARAPGWFSQRFTKSTPEPHKLAECNDDDACYHGDEDWSNTEDAS